MNWFRGLDTIVQRAIMMGLLVCAMCLIIFGISYCSEKRQADEADAGYTFADGRTGAATDASGVRDRADTRTAQIDDTVKGATDEVRNAPDPAAGRRAARNGVCRIDPSACAH